MKSSYFSLSRFTSSFFKYRSTLADPECPMDVEFLPKLVETCAANGVAVVFVPTPRGCPVSGATRWLAPNKAVLQLSLRYKTNDHLWFTIFHEAEHLLLHGKRLMFLEGADAVSQQQEDEANRFARDALIPPAEAAKPPLLGTSHDAVRNFATRVGVAPGIIVGRMQHERLIEWSHLNDLKVRYDWAPESKAYEDAS